MGTLNTRIGVMADSHGRVENTRAAIALLMERGCSLLLHLGDLGSEAVVEEFVGRNAHIVLGNCDDPGLGRYAEILDLANDHPLGLIEVDGKRIAFTHGHIERAMDQALAHGVDYLLHGHTHEVRDEMVGVTRVINPGALHRAARYTAAVLEPATGVVEILEIPRR